MRNRYRKINICVALALGSAVSLLAQSDRIEVQRWDNLQLQGNPTPSLLAASLFEAPVIASVGIESELPDAPSAAKRDDSTSDPTASPAIKKEPSHGAPPAAVGGPLGVDREVADRNYFAVTGMMFGASIANAELTLHCLQQHASCNDVPPSLKSRAAIYGIGIPADLGVAYLTYFMKRKHSHMWFVPAAGVTAANVFFGIRAFRWGRD